MKHVLLILFALIAVGAGVLILVLSKCASATAIIAGSSFILLAMALAIPAQLGAAKGTIAGVAQTVKDALTTVPPPPGGAA